MKKIFTLSIILLLAFAGFSQQILVAWHFPDDNPDLIADDGIAINLDKTIESFGGTSAIQFKNGATTKAAQATEWHDGNQVKGWITIFSTIGYSNITVSSKQTSGGAEPGPRDWMLQYKTGQNEEWNDLPGTELTVVNDWETGVLEAYLLPDDCNNQELVHLRWVMTSNTSSSGEPVLETGKSKIDDIYIHGEEANNISSLDARDRVRIWPNPCRSTLNIESITGIDEVMLFSASGKLEKFYKGIDGSIDVSAMPNGLYFIMLKLKDGSTSRSRLVISN